MERISFSSHIHVIDGNQIEEKRIKKYMQKLIMRVIFSQKLEQFFSNMNQSRTNVMSAHVQETLIILNLNQKHRNNNLFCSLLHSKILFQLFFFFFASFRPSNPMSRFAQANKCYTQFEIIIYYWNLNRYI